MRYFTREVTQNESADGLEEYKKAAILYKEEYRKARRKLPKKLIDAYENHEYFHDVLVPEISILSDYTRYITDKSRRKRNASFIKMAVIDYDNKYFALMLTFEDIKDISMRHPSGKFRGFIWHLIYNEILPADDGYISWEMVFANELNIKLVFKKLRIRDLSDEEISKYKKKIK